MSSIANPDNRKFFDAFISEIGYEYEEHRGNKLHLKERSKGSRLVDDLVKDAVFIFDMVSTFNVNRNMGKLTEQGERALKRVISDGDLGITSYHDENKDVLQCIEAKIAKSTSPTMKPTLVRLYAVVAMQKKKISNNFDVTTYPGLGNNSSFALKDCFKSRKSNDESRGSVGRDAASVPTTTTTTTTGVVKMSPLRKGAYERLIDVAKGLKATGSDKESVSLFQDAEEYRVSSVNFASTVIGGTDSMSAGAKAVLEEYAVDKDNMTEFISDMVAAGKKESAETVSVPSYEEKKVQPKTEIPYSDLVAMFLPDSSDAIIEELKTITESELLYSANISADAFAVCYWADYLVTKITDKDVEYVETLVDKFSTDKRVLVKSLLNEITIDGLDDAGLEFLRVTCRYKFSEKVKEGERWIIQPEHSGKAYVAVIYYL